MQNESLKPAEYPLLENLLAHRGLPLRGMYTVQDVAALFDVSTRTIQVRVQRQELTSRNLPGRFRFMAVDLEEFLRNSARRQHKHA